MNGDFTVEGWFAGRAVGGTKAFPPTIGGVGGPVEGVPSEKELAVEDRPDGG